MSILIAREALKPQQESVTPVGADEVAYQLSISADYVHQISQRLKKADIIKGVRGPGGGFVLAQKPESISLKTVIEACEGATFELICDEHVIQCDNLIGGGFCPVQNLWQGLKGVIDDYLASQTLQSMVETWQLKSPEGEPLVQISKHQ